MAFPYNNTVTKIEKTAMIKSQTATGSTIELLDYTNRTRSRALGKNVKKMVTFRELS
jgi:hypothetical protein